MRAGLVVSFVAHTGLIALGLVSLSNVHPLTPEEIESISIELVPIEAFSNIRVGTLESDLIETEAPSVVDTPVPAQLAERTGNTQEDQANPQDTDRVTPAPTIQTAPPPEVRPTPDPDPEAEPAPFVEPEPAPEPETAPQTAPDPEPLPEAPEPVLVVEPAAASEPKLVAPQPVVRTASIDQKREDFKRRKAEEAKRQAEERARENAEKAQEADRISSIINAEESRGATTGTGGQASAGAPTGQAARLTQSERDVLAAQMRKCWNPPLAALSEAGLTVRVLVDLNRDGSVEGTPKILSAITSSVAETTARAAQRAVLRCAPYQLASEKYEEWQQIDVTFDPRDVL